jgi:hypothetical protein
MKRWHLSAPADGHYGELDGVREQNSQEARLAYALQKVAAGQVERAFSTLSQCAQRRDGGSYISKDRERMTSPRPLWNGWYLEGCASLEQKRTIIRSLKHLGLSPGMVAAVDAFVSGEDIDKYYPTDEEAEEMIRQAELREAEQASRS